MTTSSGIYSKLKVAPATAPKPRRRTGTRLTIVKCFFAITCAVLVLISATASASTSSQKHPVSDEELRQFLATHINEEVQPFDRYDAEVWLAGMLTRIQPYKVPRDESLRILEAVYREAQASALEPDLVLAVIAIESSFNRFAVSSVGAQGLMQVMPFWKDELGRSADNLTDIDTNIRYGCKILQFYLKKSHNNVDEALARYNGSYTKKRKRSRYSDKVLAAWERHWRSGNVASATAHAN